MKNSYDSSTGQYVIEGRRYELTDAVDFLMSPSALSFSEAQEFLRLLLFESGKKWSMKDVGKREC